MKMKSTLLGRVVLAGALLILLLPLVAAGADTATVRWYDYEKGMALSQSSQRKVFLYFHADWCKFCKLMDKETFAQAAVAEFLNQNFVPIQVDSEQNPELAARYSVRGLPTVWFVSEAGEQVGGRPGYISADELMPILRYIHSDSYKTMTFQEYRKRP